MAFSRRQCINCNGTGQKSIPSAFDSLASKEAAENRKRGAKDQRKRKSSELSNDLKLLRAKEDVRESLTFWVLLDFVDFHPLGGSVFSRVRKVEKMSRNEEGESMPILSSTTGVRARPDPFLVACRCFSLLTSLAAMLCMVVNVLAAIRSFKHTSDIFDGIFRCYAVLIACFVVLAETEWGFIMKSFKVLEYWPCRGMLQIFVAVMTRAFPHYSGERWQFVLQNIACYILLACGVLYVVLGILCIGFLKRAHEQRETSREQAAKELEELERRREELEHLLHRERL